MNQYVLNGAKGLRVREAWIKVRDRLSPEEFNDLLVLGRKVMAMGEGLLYEHIPMIVNETEKEYK